MKFLKTAVICLMLTYATGCTIIRYVDNNKNNNNNTGPPPKIVDMLVLVEMERGTANLTEDIGRVVSILGAALAQQNVIVRKSAMAPMYGRSEGVVPIVYGADDPDSEFGSFAQAIYFYTQDDGVAYLHEHASADTENLSILGSNLDERAVYHPTTADPESRAFYEVAADGFVVVHIAASPRRCAADDDACVSDQGEDPVSYFTSESDGVADWLTLPGATGVPVDKIFHAVVATAEGVDYETFHKTCTGYPNFPATKLDVMEPSENVFFTSFVNGVKDNGGQAGFLDLCEAMSSRGEISIAQMSVNIRSMF